MEFLCPSTCTGEALEEARFCAPRGAANEVVSKRLLALNLRKLGREALAFVPRSYLLLPGQDEAHDEFVDFVADFQVSQALAVLKAVTQLEHRQGQPLDAMRIASEAWLAAQANPEGLHGRSAPAIAWQAGPDREQPLTEAHVQAALRVVRAATDASNAGQPLRSVDVDAGDWEVLRNVYPASAPVDPLRESLVREARETLLSLPFECQLDTLADNLWVLKPCSNGGGNGRGVLLLDRLPQSGQHLLDWLRAVGRSGHAGASDARDGCILQKVVEEPMLIDRDVLLQRPTDGPKTPQFFKFNLRLWVEASFAEPPEVWLYKDGYIDLAPQPFSGTVDPRGQVTNLLRADNDRGRGAFQRHFSTAALAEYALETRGDDWYDEVVLPKARQCIVDLFVALRAEPASTLAPTRADEAVGPGRLKRLGFDFLIDENRTVWLIEVNCLRNKYGLAAPEGPGGELKRSLAQRLREDEALLLAARQGSGSPPSSFEDLSGSVL